MEQAKAIAASWGRSYIAAALAVYMAGGDLKAMAMGISSIITDQVCTIHSDPGFPHSHLLLLSTLSWSD